MKHVFCTLCALCLLLTANARERKNFDNDWRFILVRNAPALLENTAL